MWFINNLFFFNIAAVCNLKLLYAWAINQWKTNCVYSTYIYVRHISVNAITTTTTTSTSAAIWQLEKYTRRCDYTNYEYDGIMHVGGRAKELCVSRAQKSAS